MTNQSLSESLSSHLTDSSININWLYTVGSLFLVYVIIQRIRGWYRLRHINGPLETSFSRNWLVRKTFQGNLWEDIGHLCERYGPVVRIAPDMVATSDADTLRRIWGVRSKYTRSDYYDGLRLDPAKDHVLSLRDDKAHTHLRSKMMAGYAGRENENMESSIDEQLLNLISLINKKYVSSVGDYRKIDFAHAIDYFTLDSITSLAFGKAFGFLEKDSDVYDWMHTVAFITPYIGTLGLLPEMTYIMQSRLLRPFLPSAKDKTGFGRVLGLAKEVVSERFGPNKKGQKDMLASFVRHGLSQDQCESEILLQILAGGDTTATGIRATMLYIITSPWVYQHLLSEILLGISQNRISQPIRDSEAKTLPYLQACIKEGLRMYPPGAGIIPKEVQKGGDTIAGVYIPEGTKVGYCAWGVYKNKETFGQDADMFRPERWLETSGEELARMNSTWDLIFSPGKWQCLGKSVALMELNKVFVELLRNFDFSVVDASKPWKSLNYSIFLQSEMWLRVTKREPIDT